MAIRPVLFSSPDLTNGIHSVDLGAGRGLGWRWVFLGKTHHQCPHGTYAGGYSLLTGHEARNHTAIQVLSVFNTSVWGYGVRGFWGYGNMGMLVKGSLGI